MDCRSCGHHVGAHDDDGICSLCKPGDVCGPGDFPDEPGAYDPEPEDSPGEVRVWRGKRVGAQRGDY